MNNKIIYWGISGLISLKTLTCYFAVQWMSNDLQVGLWLIERSFLLFFFCIFVHEFLVSWVCVPWVMKDEYGRCTALLAMRWVIVKAHRCDVLLWQCEPRVYWDIRMCQGERDALVNWGLDVSFSLKYITKSLRQHDSKGNTCRYIQTTDSTFYLTIIWLMELKTLQMKCGKFLIISLCKLLALCCFIDYNIPY